MKKVYIVGGGRVGCAYAQMFISRGWEVVDIIRKADLVQFTGGSDVTPALYQEQPHPRTGNDPARDVREVEAYLQAQALGKKIAGICRGGQFLNVMCGGKLWQHVDGHGIGEGHMAITHGLQEIRVSSTHHQMMIPGWLGEVMLEGPIGDNSQSTYKECVPDGSVLRINAEDCHHGDVESVLYDSLNVLCFQPHPEFNGFEECRDYYFELIDVLMGDADDKSECSSAG